MPATIAERLSERFTSLRYGALPAETRHGVKRLLLDYLGVAIGGSRTDSGRVAQRYARGIGGKPQATLVANGVRVPMENAALANAICSHSLELDDIDVLALFHFSPPVYSAALAAAEAVNASGRELVTALAAGCEMMERASNATNNALRNRGFHTTPTCGVFGATVAAGKLLALDAAQMTSALGLAGAQASGLMEMYGPSMQKRFNPGPSARNGVAAASMARQGFTGAATIFEGERGFCRAFSDGEGADRLLAGLRRAYDLAIEFKPYSCARPIHNAIDCALEIRRRHAPALGAIERIVMARHPDWAHYHQNAAPRSYHEAQVSLPFSVAVALRDGAALLAQYSDRNIADPLIKRVSSRVEFVVDRRLPRGVSCKMTLAVKGGRAFAAQVDYPKGSIQNPMSDAELEAKFQSLAAPVIGDKRCDQLVEAVARLERLQSVRALLRSTAPAGRRVRAS